LANTASTKSGKSKKGRTRAAAATTAETKSKARIEPDPASPGQDIPERAWLISVLVIMVVAAVLRLYDLNLVPMHHDEGVNGNFLVRLVREGVYTYDPANYHGPTLYYFAALFPWIVRVLFGKSAMESYALTTVAVRMVPALFGLGTIGLVFLLRRWLGTIATLTAALLLALSPGAVYLSRYFIHETLFVFFTLGIVVAGLYFYEQRKPFHLMLASASASLLFATKETAMISAAVLVIAFAMTLIYMRMRKVRTGAPHHKGRFRPEPSRLSRFVDDLGGPVLVLVYVLLALLVFGALWAAFYSSFFTNSQGVSDSFKTFQIWTKTGTGAHVHPWTTYPRWLLSQEAPVLLLGALGALAVVIEPKKPFALFSALWAFGLIAAYTLIPYKTPWLVLSFVVPLALIAGYAFQAIYELGQRQLRLSLGFLLLPLCVSIYQTIDLNFKNYDNDNSYYVYVYAHTTRGMLDLVKEIERIADKESGGQTGITIVSPDYWPLPWYLRNYGRVGYYGRMAPSTEPLIIANEAQKTEMEENFSAVYRQVESGKSGGSYDLRPGVRLLLYERRPNVTTPQPPSIR
jgi:uncharacterized protein (TIGR03663 family)